MLRLLLLASFALVFNANTSLTAAQNSTSVTSSAGPVTVASSSGAATSPSTTTYRTTTANATTAANFADCAFQKSCERCVGVTSAKCVWCEKENSCKEVLSLGLTDIGSVCTDGLWNANWGLCAVNMMALIIGVSAAGGVLLIALLVCCCCCCCRRSNGMQSRFKREDEKLDQEKEVRRQKYAEKKAERLAKNDEIRRKYGLTKDETPYQRFDA